MTAFFITFEKLVTLFIIAVIGYILRKTGLISGESVKGIANIVTRVTIPVSVINSLQMEYSPERLKTILIYMPIMVLMAATGLMIGFLTAKLLRLPNQVKAVWLFSCMTSNALLMGQSVVSVLFDRSLFFYASISVVVTNLLVYSAGVYILQKASSGSGKKIKFSYFLKSPAIICFIIGCFLFVYSVQLPSIIKNALASLGSMTSPLALMMIGTILATVKINEVFNDWRVYILCTLRLLVIPIISFVILKLVIPDFEAIAVLTIILGMSGLAIAPILAQENGGDAVWAAKYTFMSTLLSLFSIPVLKIITMS